jgi:hypothetical protein
MRSLGWTELASQTARGKDVTCLRGRQTLWCVSFGGEERGGNVPYLRSLNRPFSSESASDGKWNLTRRIAPEGV